MHDLYASPCSVIVVDWYPSPILCHAAARRVALPTNRNEFLLVR